MAQLRRLLFSGVYEVKLMFWRFQMFLSSNLRREEVFTFPLDQGHLIAGE